MRRHRLALLILLLALAAGALWWTRRQIPAARHDDAGARAATPEVPDVSRPGPTPASAPTPTPRSVARAKRDALRQAIADTLVRQSSPGSPAKPPGSPNDSPPPPPAGTLVDRTGNHEALARYLSGDFMPLADECIEQAQAQSPQLAGMLVLRIATAADDQLGAVVDVADPAPNNEIADPGLLECIRETALSLSFPPHLGNGQDKFEVSLRIKPITDAGR